LRAVGITFQPSSDRAVADVVQADVADDLSIQPGNHAHLPSGVTWLERLSVRGRGGTNPQQRAAAFAGIGGGSDAAATCGTIR